MARVGVEGALIDSLSKFLLTMYYVPGPVLGAKDKAVNKAARDSTPWSVSLSRETCYNQLQKLCCGHHGAGWHTGEAEGAGRVREGSLVSLEVREGKSRESLSSEEKLPSRVSVVGQE